MPTRTPTARALAAITLAALLAGCAKPDFVITRLEVRAAESAADDGASTWRAVATVGNVGGNKGLIEEETGLYRTMPVSFVARLREDLPADCESAGSGSSGGGGARVMQTVREVPAVPERSSRIYSFAGVFDFPNLPGDPCFPYEITAFANQRAPEFSVPIEEFDGSNNARAVAIEGWPTRKVWSSQ